VILMVMTGMSRSDDGAKVSETFKHAGSRTSTARVDNFTTFFADTTQRMRTRMVTEKIVDASSGKSHS
jgi:hypothetical protein